jgi:hypothetical protein
MSFLALVKAKKDQVRLRKAKKQQKAKRIGGKIKVTKNKLWNLAREASTLDLQALILRIGLSLQEYLCDEVLGLKVRARGYCESGRPSHAGGLQCAHGWSRTYRGTRWHEENVFCFCAGCHTYYTHRPIEWDDWLIARWGRPKYDAMREQALHGGRQDMEAVLTSLKIIQEKS